MVTRNLSLLIIAVVLGGLSTACTQDEPANSHKLTHYSARRHVTGSNVPQAAAYGDGVDDSSANGNALGQMEQNYSSHTAGSSGSPGMSGGGAR